MNLPLIFHIFSSFFKIGSIAFGGGYAVIPLLQREVVERRKWVTPEELAEMMTISQTLPGIIMVNSATMIGAKVAGFWGAFAATFAAIAPTFILTILVTTFFWNHTNNPIIKKALIGVLLGITAMIIYSIIKMWDSVIRNYFDLLLVIISSSLLLFFRANVVLVIIGVALLGLVYNYLLLKLGRKSR